MGDEGPELIPDPIEPGRMPKGPWLAVCCGLPGSGKSTWADKLVALGSTVAVSLEFWKEQTFAGGVAKDQELSAALTLLRKNYRVVVDDCNLLPERRAQWRKLARGLGIRYIEVPFTASAETCIARQLLRDKKVPASAIRNMAKQAKVFPKPRLADYAHGQVYWITNYTGGEPAHYVEWALSRKAEQEGEAPVAVGESEQP